MLFLKGNVNYYEIKVQKFKRKKVFIERFIGKFKSKINFMHSAYFSAFRKQNFKINIDKNAIHRICIATNLMH